MRDPKRIDTFVDALKEAWLKYPDLRFGQFICNFFGYVLTKNPTICDIFFVEDDAMLKYLRGYIDELSNKNG